MQPISNIWNKLPRIVRDVAHTCGKEVRLEMNGKDTELDKTIIEAIKDPLTHVIRNAVDHGIEIPAARTAAGKPAEGTLSLKAYHEGGQVIIEIADDGSGLNTKRIREKAVEKGIVSAAAAETLTESEIHRMILLPGFSTAEKITNISGRGVGMDVVRSNIEAIGGTLDLVSRAGQGTTFIIKIPLTLAIIPALIVSTRDCRYAIPQVNLLELVRVELSEATTGLETIGSSSFYRLRGKLLPLVYLSDQLQLTRSSDTSSVMNVVVVRADHQQFGLVVDAIHDTEEIVVKPLGRLLKGIPAFSGATIMGDGQVALILDVAGIAKSAGIARNESTSRLPMDTEDRGSKESEASRLVIFELGSGQRAAVYLDQIYRLEEFPRERLESSGGRWFVQYRDGILPLIYLSEALNGRTSDNRELVEAFVYDNGGTLVGFAVDKIVDIVEQAVDIKRAYSKPGVMGLAVIQEKITDVVDLSEILECAGLRVRSSSAIHGA